MLRSTRTLLCQEKSISLLECNSVSRVLVVGRKSGGVRALGHSTVEDFAERVDALARRGVFSVHQMHIDVCDRVNVKRKTGEVVATRGVLQTEGLRSAALQMRSRNFGVETAPNAWR